MAIDTETKRRSVQNYAVGGGMLPVADGDIDMGDRATLASIYAGLQYGEAPVILTPNAIDAPATVEGLPTSTIHRFQLNYS